MGLKAVRPSFPVNRSRHDNGDWLLCQCNNLILPHNRSNRHLKHKNLETYIYFSLFLSFRFYAHSMSICMCFTCVFIIFDKNLYKSTRRIDMPQRVYKGMYGAFEIVVFGRGVLFIIPSESASGD